MNRCFTHSIPGIGPIALGVILLSSPAGAGGSRPDRKEVLSAFNQSYRQIAPKITAQWDSIFRGLGIQDEPLAMAVRLIQFFSPPNLRTEKGLYTLAEMIDRGQGNALSGCIALTALMQARQWDVECFYNDEECYLGFNLGEDWQVRKGSWVEMDGKRYYLKEFDDSTAVGEIRIDRPGIRYLGLRSLRRGLKPIPIVDRLPSSSGRPSQPKRLAWTYDYVEHEITVEIPESQLAWTRNLPASLSGMVRCGLDELRRIGLDRQLRNLVEAMTEFEQVDFLLKFCQSEASFRYKSGLPIRSVTRQIWDGANDCDGRSVLLGGLLCTVLNYSLDDIVFVSWENHLALGVRPRTELCLDTLMNSGYRVEGGYYVLDPAYTGATHWGSKMKNLPEKYEVIKIKQP